MKVEVDVQCMFGKVYHVHRATCNLCSRFRLIVRFAVEIPCILVGKDHQRRAEFTCAWGQNQETYPEAVTRKKIRAA